MKLSTYDTFVAGVNLLTMEDLEEMSKNPSYEDRFMDFLRLV
jgi:hypothetical protein